MRNKGMAVQDIRIKDMGIKGIRRVRNITLERCQVWSKW